MSDSIISNLSYTNKDFNTIYPELLDLVKKLTYKWDPSISNESDPGVILIKLNALIADKCNYSSDKNVLECFPLSVTQESNARQLYEQLGYYMHWYNSAKVQVFISFKNEDGTYTEDDFCYIPEFTTVSDIDNNVVSVKYRDKQGTGVLTCDPSINNTLNNFETTVFPSNDLIKDTHYDSQEGTDVFNFTLTSNQDFKDGDIADLREYLVKDRAATDPDYKGYESSGIDAVTLQPFVITFDTR